MKNEIIEKLLIKLLENEEIQENKSIFDEAIGEYVIVRTWNEGLNFGKLIAANEYGCVLENARRIHRSISKDHTAAWYEGIARSGIDSEKGRISCAVERKYIIEKYSITLCSQDAIINLQNTKPTPTDL